MVFILQYYIFFSLFSIEKKQTKRIPRHGPHLENALYRTLYSIKQKFQKGARPKCFIQDIVQYKE